MLTRLYVMNRDGSGSKLITENFDRDVRRPFWSTDGKGIYFQYDDEGNTKIGYVSLNGKIETLAGDVGGSFSRATLFRRDFLCFPKWTFYIYLLASGSSGGCRCWPQGSCEIKSPHKVE